MSREESDAEGISIVITGSRSRNPTREEMNAFWRLLRSLEPVLELHHGAATGVDSYVAAQVRGLRPDIRVVPHPALWRPAGRSGPVDRRAGPIRNGEMLVLGSALLAFPGGSGTADCCRQARELGRRVLSVAEEVERHKRA